MIPTSEKYKELSLSNVRPKVEPIIILSKPNEENMLVEVYRFVSSDITGFSYKRGIDPLGRSLPYMELTWEEVYSGNIREDFYVEKYGDIEQYMCVQIVFEQNLEFSSSWKSLYEEETKWADLYDKTWKSVYKDLPKETIEFPRLLLDGKPIIENNKIKWSAKDALYFWDRSTSEDKEAGYSIGQTLGSAFGEFVSREFYLWSQSEGMNKRSYMYWYAKSTYDNATDYGNYEIPFTRVYPEEKTNIRLMNLCGLFNKHIDFEYGRLNYFDYPTEEEISTGEEIPTYIGNVMYKYPKITKGTDVGKYEGNIYAISEDTKIMGLFTEKSTTNEIDGEKYSEENKLKIVAESGMSQSQKENLALNRVKFIANYFNEISSVLEFESLANLSVETGDVISVETNLYNSNEEKVFKNAFVVSTELKYNGSLKQKIIAHEFNGTKYTDEYVDVSVYQKG